jgi:acyl carrier protein
MATTPMSITPTRIANVEARTLEILAHYFGRPAADLARTTRFREDLGADSLDLVELLFEIERTFDVSIPEMPLGELRTVADAIACLERAVAGREG